MEETALKFGPEWLRVLSHGGTSSPPSSPLPLKFKMAVFRYGREEMLALYSNDLPPPDDYDHLGVIFVENMQQPLSLLPLNAEEQRMFARGVNSEAVLRGTGRPPTNGAGRGRGGSVDRGRGRGRGGIGAPYYSRGISYDEDVDGQGHMRDAGPPGMGGRGKMYERPCQNVNEIRGWNDRGIPDRTLNPTLEDKGIGMVSPRKEPNRANNENWRSRGVVEVGDRWSGLGSNRNEKWGPRATWREREIGPEGEWDDMKSHPNTGGYARVRSTWDTEREKDMMRRKWEENNLPEWATESTDDKGGSFDSSGAFHAPGYSDDEAVDSSGNNIKKSEIINPSSRPDVNREHNTQSSDAVTEFNKKLMKKENKIEVENYNKQVNLEEFHPAKNYSLLANGNLSERERAHFVMHHKQDDFNLGSRAGGKREREVEDLEHMQIVADDLVAKLVDDDPKMVNADVKVHQPNIPPPAGFNCHNNQLAPEDQWFYTDPQGEIQGPFSSEDMAAWYEVGYFKSNLLLRRQCDDRFARLGDLMGLFGRMPFLPGPAVPPLKVSDLIAQRALAHREQLELQAYQLKLQIYQQQTAVREQQVLQQLQNLDDWNKLSGNQRQQLFGQHMMSLPHLQPPAIPPALQDLVPPATTASMITIPSNVLSAKNSRPAMGVSPVSGQPQDPIEVLMTQMQNQQVAGPISIGGGSSALDVPVQMSAPATSCVASEGPLQKLLSQLQRGPTSSPPVAPTLPHSTAKVAPQQQQSVSQTDPIKAFLNQMSKRPPVVMDAAQEEHKRREEEKLMKAERKLYEVQHRQKEERQEQEELRYLEKIQEERRLKELEEEKQLQLKQEQEREERRKQEELERRMELKRIAEEAKLFEEESRKEQKIRRKLLEEAKRREEAKKKEEAERQEAKRKEDERIATEKKKKEEKKQEEERKRKERQAHNQEQMRKHALEEERKRMNKVDTVTKRSVEEQKKPKNVKQTPAAWNSKTGREAVSTPSLAEIQKTQEIKDRKEKEAESKDQRRLKEATKKANEEKQRQKELNQGWAGAIKPNKNAQLPRPPVKSLLEVQQEEEKELKKRLKKEQAERSTAVNHLSLNAAGVWGSAAQSLSWANRASSSGGNLHQPSNPLPPSQPTTLGWAAIAQGGNVANSTSNGDNSGGFWDDPAGKISKSHSTVSSTAMPSKTLCQPVLKPNLAVNNKLAKKKNKDDSLKKIFSDTINSGDGFACWCNSALSTMKVNASIDIPTFVGFLADVDSPYDVHDYIRSYLGDSKEVRTFARDYLEKRSKAKNALRQSRNEDDILAPAPAVNPTNNQEFTEINKTKVKKSRKKMQKLDNNLLGFTLPASEQPTEKK